MRDGSFVTIQAWMREELELKGNNLIIYAVIYGFSQDGISYFSGSAGYLANWCGISRQSAMNILVELCKNKVIEKRERFEHGLKYCDYRAVISLQGVKKDDRGGVKKDDTPCQKTLHHNKEIYIDIDSREKEPEQSVQTRDVQEKAQKRRVKKEFSPPTEKEVIEYVTEKRMVINPFTFFSYYSNLDWKDANGNQVKNWKAKANTWNMRDIEKNPNKKPFESPALPDSSSLGKKIVTACPDCGVELDEYRVCPRCRCEYDVSGVKL